MIVEIDREVPRYESYAAERTRGLYNVGADDGARFQLTADIPAERDDWQIGVVVGPSGSGKTSIASALIEHGYIDGGILLSGMWGDQPVIEELTERSDYKKATASLAAVGLGSVPAWLRPHNVLSNGEGFRADLAMLLMDPPARVYVDEFTSVLDRQVAKVGAGAFAKAWRRRTKSQIILITPHYDILEWIEPDWVLDTAEGLNKWTKDRGVVKAREGTFQPDHGFRGAVIGSITV